MISPELLRRYPFFAGMEHQHLVVLANAAEELTVPANQYIFREGEALTRFYLNVEGAAAIVLELPDSTVEQSVAGQLIGEITTKDVVISTVGPGEVFGWSGLVPPHESTGSAKALTHCRVIAFDCGQLRQAFEKDCELGYRMMQRAAQVIRGRLTDLRIESLAEHMDR